MVYEEDMTNVLGSNVCTPNYGICVLKAPLLYDPEGFGLAR